MALSAIPVAIFSAFNWNKCSLHWCICIYTHVMYVYMYGRVSMWNCSGVCVQTTLVQVNGMFVLSTQLADIAHLPSFPLLFSGKSEKGKDICLWKKYKIDATTKVGADGVSCRLSWVVWVMAAMETAFTISLRAFHPALHNISWNNNSNSPAEPSPVAANYPDVDNRPQANQQGNLLNSCQNKQSPVLRKLAGNRAAIRQTRLQHSIYLPSNTQWPIGAKQSVSANYHCHWAYLGWRINFVD